MLANAPRDPHRQSRQASSPQSRSDRMGRRNGPDQFAIVRLAPAQVAAGAHQPAENLRQMPGVQHDQTNPRHDPPMNPLDHGVTDAVVGQMPPPEQHVGTVQDIVGQPVIGRLEDRRLHLGARQARPQGVGDRTVNTARV